MRKSRFPESQIVGILTEGEAGIPISDLVRKHGISRAKYSNWRSKYAGTSVAELKRLKELEAEDARLKRMHASSRWRTPPSRMTWAENGNAGRASSGDRAVSDRASAFGPSRLARRRTGGGGVVCPAGGRHHAGRGSDRGTTERGRGQS